MAREKSPAFQFYPSDFLADSSVCYMDATERGVYIILLCHCWIDGSIPADPKEIRRLARYNGRHWTTVWDAVQRCFSAATTGVPGRLIQPRIERERQKQADYRLKRQLAGQRGGQQKASNRLASAIAKRSSSSSSSDLKGDNQLIRKISTAAPPLRAVAKQQSKPPDNRLRVMVKIAHACLESRDPPTDFASLKDAVKTHCAKASIRYDSDLVGRAVESALAQRGT